MCFFKQAKPADERQDVIDYLRHATDKDYKDVLKIVDIYRDADEQVAIVEAGSKKALREAQKEDGELSDALDGLMEASNGK
jgi:hypothetical protein